MTERASREHAVVELHEGRLHLRRIRGRLIVDGEDVSYVPLEQGMRVFLQKDQMLYVDVIEVCTPPFLHSLYVEGGAYFTLITPTNTLVLPYDSTKLVLRPHYDPRGLAHVFLKHNQWWFHGGGDTVDPLASDSYWLVGESRVFALERSIHASDSGPIATQGSRLPLSGVADEEYVFRLMPYDHVSLSSPTCSQIQMGGQIGVMLTMLLSERGYGIPRDVVARRLWPEYIDEPELLRDSFFGLLNRARNRKLKPNGYPPELLMMRNNVLFLNDDMDFRIVT